jgi:hypothetical protein
MYSVVTCGPIGFRIVGILDLIICDKGKSNIWHNFENNNYFISDNLVVWKFYLLIILLMNLLIIVLWCFYNISANNTSFICNNFHFNEWWNCVFNEAEISSTISFLNSPTKDVF